MNLICNMCWKITLLKLQPHLSGANELNTAFPELTRSIPYILVESNPLVNCNFQLITCYSAVKMKACWLPLEINGINLP